MARLLWICLGGACGTGARYLVSIGVARFEPGFPWATLAINALGSFLIGFVLVLAAARDMDETLKLALTVGVLGGFTTYSTFNYETIRLAHDGRWTAAVLNVAATLGVCLAAGLAGIAAARALVGK